MRWCGAAATSAAPRAPSTSAVPHSTTCWPSTASTRRSSDKRPATHSPEERKEMIESTPKAARLEFREIQIGQTFEIERSFSSADVEQFAAVSGDWSPLHVNSDYAKTTEFGGCVVH